MTQVTSQMPATRIMLLTNQLHASPSGGRELLCKLNHDVLKDIYGDRLVLFELPRSRLHGLKAIANAFRGHIDGLSSAVIAEALRTVQAENIEKVFVDGSNLGAFVKASRKMYPEVQVYTFFHNVEARFFLGSLRQTGTARALSVLVANYLAEKKSVRFSDRIICLSERDSRLLRRIYGRSATDLSAMALRDNLPEGESFPVVPEREKFALFVGGVFYANRAGIVWFIKYVVPRIRVKLCIVGRGFEDLKHKLERDGMVEVVGAVDSVAPWYLGSQFVIAPIFDGSGMKTKVAEALMFGKKVIGTPEAFSGYEDIESCAGLVCSTADEFVSAIERLADEPVADFDPALRALYEEKYSYPAARLRLAEILGT
ncbi:MAG: glycosyltransferase [Gammaproteobacteria bacterium]